MVLDSASSAAQCGDEPLLIRKVTGVPVAIGCDRVAAAKLLLAAHEDDGVAVDMLVADDGLQHYPLFRNVDICVIDGERRFGNGRLLPAGPLREPLARLETVMFRVCNGDAAQPGEIPMRLLGDTAITLNDTMLRKPLDSFAGQRVHAVAGIGNPARFFAMLRAAGIDVIEHAFADHHPYQPGDLDFGDGLPVLMTEKDAIKCVAFSPTNAWQVPVRAELPAEFFDALARQCG